MARETKVIQCRPDRESDEISFHERFGWEVLSNQRCQEQEKIDGEWYTATFNKITFSRDKSQPWYNRVCELEKEANALIEYGIDAVNGEAHGIVAPEKVECPKIAKRTPFFVGLVILIVGLLLMIIIPSFAPVLIAIGLFLTIANRKNLKGLTGEEAEKATEAYKKYKTEYDEYVKQLNVLVNKRLDEISNELFDLI